MLNREQCAIELSFLHAEYALGRDEDDSPWYMDLLLEEIGELTEKNPLGAYELTLQELAGIAEKRAWCVLKEQLLDDTLIVQHAREVTKMYAEMIRELSEQYLNLSVPTHHEEEVPVLHIRLLSVEGCKYYVSGEFMD